MNAERLSWDSDFFGFEVGCVMVSKEDALDADGLSNAVEGLNVELAYVFLPSDMGCGMERLRSALVSMSGKLVDHKVTLNKRLVSITDASKNVVPATSLTHEIESLAYASGWCSRFAAEDRLRPFFRPLYKRWLQNDFRDGAVLVKTSGDGRVIGITTVSVRGVLGRIGLVAVDVNHCRMGVATDLLRSAEAWLLSQDVRECQVVTQYGNVAGMSLYERCGYEVSQRQEVWHVWRTSSK